MRVSTLEALTTTIAPVFPFVGADERFSLMLAGEPPSERTGGIWVSLDAVRWKTEQGTVGIDDVRRQSVLLVPRAAWPIDRRMVPGVLGGRRTRHRATAPPERSEWAVPADWLDGDLLLPDPRSPERGPELVAALQPEAIALRKMVKWLSSGFEFGAPPTSIALWERRVMNWPPTKDRRELFLFRYEYPATAGDEPRRGVGLVGSTTFSMFGAGAPRVDGTLEDALAAHCLFELGRTSAELSIGRALLGFAE